ncbi:MAG TPA: hypothetical protein VMV46_05380 [Thermoanaerobaculia bacterium]|nr:hypothetical protein [Thermoanaerobaculia bacterium]
MPPSALLLRRGLAAAGLPLALATLAVAQPAAEPSRIGTYLQQVFDREATLPPIDPPDPIRRMTLGEDGFPVVRFADRHVDGRFARFDPTTRSWQRASAQVADPLEQLGVRPSVAPPGDLLAVADSYSGSRVAKATTDGLWLAAVTRGEDPHGARLDPSEALTRLEPADGRRRWSATDVRALDYDPSGTLWFVSTQGIGRYDGEAWRLFDERDGLPWSEPTSIAAAGADDLWIGTTIGLVHLRLDQDGAPYWEYRQGRRWLPDDHVLAVAVDAEGAVWAATPGGVGVIRHVPMTLAEKARRFERAIDAHHRRTEHGYVDGVILERPGDPSSARQRDSDNDGLWTSMYGAAECLAFAVTGDSQARERARRAFEALRFLQTVTQGGDPPARPGFVARTVLPADGPDPNAGRLEQDLRHKAERDGRWKLYQPRWPKSADGRWYWKSDTSSDELDGHFFFYALYYDHVASDPQTGSETDRDELRAVVRGIVDHLLAHDLALVDHDETPTRWAQFGPGALNADPEWWEERGLNSYSILAYLRIAEHVTGDPSYGAAAAELITRHSYLANARSFKVQSGSGTGNQSDDEMGFMNLYHLVRYETNPVLRSLWAHTFDRYFALERPERNPLFTYLWAAAVDGERYRDAFDDLRFGPTAADLEEAAETLRRYPLDRIQWSYRNSHRLDVEQLPDSTPERPRGRLAAGPDRGKVLAIDERFVNHWNVDPWRLDEDGGGRSLADGASFLLPYWLGRHHGLLVDQSAEPDR